MKMHNTTGDRSSDSRERLLNELDNDMRYPGVDVPGALRYTRDLPGSPGTRDESVLYLRILYAWLPVLDDAGYRVPKLKTWDADWGGDPDLADAERAMTGQLQNASPAQITSYERVYRSRKSAMRDPMGAAEEKFVTDHLSTPWRRPGGSKHLGETPSWGAAEGPFFVTLSAAPNYDFGPGGHEATIRIPARKQKAASLADASKAVQLFIRQHELGGGNWTGGLITDAAGNEIGRVSYNGRVWGPNGEELLDAAPLRGAGGEAFARRRGATRSALKRRGS